MEEQKRKEEEKEVKRREEGARQNKMYVELAQKVEEKRKHKEAYEPPPPVSKESAATTINPPSGETLAKVMITSIAESTTPTPDSIATAVQFSAATTNLLPVSKVLAPNPGMESLHQETVNGVHQPPLRSDPVAVDVTKLSAAQPSSVVQPSQAKQGNEVS